MTEPRVEAGDRALETARKALAIVNNCDSDSASSCRRCETALTVLVNEALADVAEEYKSLGFRAGVEAEQSAMNALVKPLKDECDRDWKDETPEQIVAIAANAIYWRGKHRESAMNAQERDFSIECPKCKTLIMGTR